MTARQVIEAMTIFFVPEAAGDLEGVIQFRLSGSEPGDYHIRLSGDECRFGTGIAPDPTLTTDTPSEVWMKIANQEISGAEALAQGLYKVEGDMGLLARLGELFRPGDEEMLKAPPSQRPPGPLPLPGMAWFYVVQAAWVVFLITFGMKSVSRWVSLGLPLALFLALALYRLVFYRLLWAEACSLAFFAVAGVLVATGYAAFTDWGAVIGFAAFSAIWLSSVLLGTPLTSEYSKWAMNRRIWDTTMFAHPNAVLTLMWGCVFTLMGLLVAFSKLWSGLRTPMAIAAYSLMLPAMAVTIRYPKGAGSRPFVWERSLARMRWVAAAGLAADLALAAVLLSGALKPAT